MGQYTRFFDMVIYRDHMCDFPGQVLFYICGPTEFINSFPFHIQKCTGLNDTFYKHSSFEEDIHIFIIVEREIRPRNSKWFAKGQHTQLLNWVAQPWNQDYLNLKSHWLFWSFCLTPPRWAIVTINITRISRPAMTARCQKSSSFLSRREKRELRIAQF